MDKKPKSIFRTEKHATLNIGNWNIDDEINIIQLYNVCKNAK